MSARRRSMRRWIPSGTARGTGRSGTIRPSSRCRGRTRPRAAPSLRTTCRGCAGCSCTTTKGCRTGGGTSPSTTRPAPRTSSTSPTSQAGRGGGTLPLLSSHPPRPPLLGGAFEEGAAFSPFEQLMSVFPPASGHALPAAYRQPRLAEMSRDEPRLAEISRAPAAEDDTCVGAAWRARDTPVTTR